MTLKLSAIYRTAGDLAYHLKELVAQGALLLPMNEQVDAIQQYQPLQLQIGHADAKSTVAAEVLQVIPSVGVVVRLELSEEVLSLAGDAEATEGAEPPRVAVLDPNDASDPAQKPVGRPGTSVVSWPIEKLQAEWHNLSVPEKVRAARYGKRPIRGWILKQQDKAMHNHLLSNPHISPEEVAVMAGMVNLDPAVLRRIVSSQEWLRHTSVARNLVCHPKLTLPQVTKVIGHVSSDELRRLTRTGKVRASAKRLIIKKIEQREGRR
jgi:hypothetical protein